MRFPNILKWFVTSQRNLGPLLRFESIVPFTILVMIIGGNYLTLPPGPLCDEGMVLFMEGGCDYGLSNVFFFAKVSLLLTIQLAVVIAWRRPPQGWSGLSLHFGLLAGMAFVLRRSEHCETYYSHPNGSLGQMIVELACFAALGVVMVRALPEASRTLRGLAFLAWNGLHVGLFYAFLLVWPHWTWNHSFAVGVSMLAIAGVISNISDRRHIASSRGALSS